MDDIEADLDLAPDLPILWAEGHRLHEVVVNLMSSAHRALREWTRPRRLSVAARLGSGTRRLALFAVNGFLVASLLVAACGRTPVPPVAVRTGDFAVQSLLPLYVIAARGLDKHHGIEVRREQYQHGFEVIEAIANGSLDLGDVGSVPILKAAEFGIIPDRAVVFAASSVADSEHPGLGVLGAHSLSGWKELSGKRIAVVGPNTLDGASIKTRLLQEGIRDFTLVPISSQNMGLAVAGGNVAAATMSEPLLTHSLQRNDGRFLGWVIGGPPFERVVFSMLVANTELVRSRPEILKRYLRAHLDAVQWIEKNPREARRLLATSLRLVPAVADRVKLMRWPPDAKPDLSLLNAMQPRLVEAGVLGRPVAAERLYDGTLLGQVLGEGR